MRRFAIFVLAVPLGLFGQLPANLGFETGKVGFPPAGWQTFSNPSGLAFSSTLAAIGCLEGRMCVLMTGPSSAPSSAFGDLSQTVSATPYRGNFVSFRVAVRADGPNMRAILWFSTSSSSAQLLILNSPSITSTDWQYYALGGQVSNDAVTVTFGVLSFGSSRIWVDDGSVLVANQEGPRALSDTGLANLTAFAKVLGYVRHFHPSDQVPLVDWDSFAAYGARTVEGAQTPEELAAQLQTLFDPIAPTIQVFATGSQPPLPTELQPASLAGLHLVRWNHFGIGLGVENSLYHSTRDSIPTGGPFPAGFQSPTKPYQAEIGRGLSVAVPLSLYSDSGGTLPHRPLPADHCCVAGPDDRGTRQAGVIVAWNVARHFYPYFDVVPTDWPAALSDALRSAAVDSGAAKYLVTLSKMWATLHDGHGRVIGPQSNLLAPVVWDWVENQLVITAAKPGAGTLVSRGDRVLRIDGTPVEDAIAAQQPLISGATPQWILYRTLLTLAQCADGGRTMQLEIEHYATPGVSLPVQLTCGSDSTWNEPRPSTVAQLEPGIMYVDINNLTSPLWSGAEPGAGSAQGVIFDLRGYPQIVDFLQNLAPGHLNSAQWHIPTPALPDQVNFTFQRDPSWDLPPVTPLISGRRVFLTDGRAISFAESEMGIVEAYQLAEIVGSTTAGTNGNINIIYLPGGYQLVFTGMKVIKNDGSQHHGVGIHATIPAGRTRKGIAEGRDEVLERGITVVKGPQPGPTPRITAVVNAASYAEGPVAPGEIVTIFGTNLGPEQVAQTVYDGPGFLGTWAGETRVFFDNIQAPLVYASATQVSAIVPYQVTASTKLRVEYQLRSSDVRVVPLAAAAPGVFTASGKSQATAVNQNGSFNSDSNPAARGEIVTLFATGSGATSPAGVTGKLPPPGRAPAGKVAVNFADVAGEIQSAGEIAAGVLQINVRVPASAQTGAGVPLTVLIDGVASPARATIAVK
jgi:uncharacterized protein (TIGR03437 family)